MKIPQVLSSFLAFSLLALFTACAGIGISPNLTYQLTITPVGSGTVVSSPSGINCGTSCAAPFSATSSVTLTAAPASGYSFTGWSGACSGAASCVVTMDSNTAVTATFTAIQNPVTLTVALAGNGSGAVTSSPAGINCGTACTFIFAKGTQVTLTPTPASGSAFTGWSGACAGLGPCVVTLGTSTSVTANFAVSVPTVLTVALAGTGTGTVTSSPTGISCLITCSATFLSGTQITLSETPAPGATFTGWSGGGCSGTGACVVTLLNATTVTATFGGTATAYTLSIDVSGTGGGAVTSSPAGLNCAVGSTCYATFPTGTQVTLSAAPSQNSYLVDWGSACSGYTTCDVTVNMDESVTATVNVWPINHIIFLAQENRSFDHYFGALRDYWKRNGYPDQSYDGLPQFNPVTGIPPLQGPAPSNPGCDPASPPPADCVYDVNNPVTSFHLKTQCVENPSPFWNESHVDWNFHDQVGRYGHFAGDGFVHTSGHDGRALGYYDTDGLRAMGYYTDADLPYYYFMASNFGTSDRWFNPVMTRTNPNREYLIGATSHGYVYPIGSNAQDMQAIPTPTIFQSLLAAGVSWKIYVNPTNSPCTPPYQASCLVQQSYVSGFAWGQSFFAANPQYIGTIGIPGSDFDNDVANGTLPAVAQIEPASYAGLDEHPSDYDNAPIEAQAGAKYVAGLMNEVMQSSSWQDTAFILTFDEYGGFFDHNAPQPAISPDGIPPVDLQDTPYMDVCYGIVQPPSFGICDFTYTGYRVPLVVASPYAKKNYVSHTVMDTTAIMKLIEERFILAPINARDAAQPSMQEFFDFNNPPWLTPPTPPAQPTNGACYLNMLP